MKKTALIAMLALTFGFAQDAKFSGLGFYELSYNNDKGEDISNTFDFNRVYFTFEKNISETLNYKFQTDVGRKGDDGRLEVYLKNAKLSWKTDFGKLVFGLQGLNVFNVQEKTWGYRSVEKSAMDKFKFASSADLGAGFYTKVGEVSYSTLVTNGSGYKKPENDSYKKLSGQVFYGPAKLNSTKGMNVGAVITYEPYKDDESDAQKVIVVGLFGGYSAGSFRGGAELNQLMDSAETDNVLLLSGYGNYEISKIVSLFGRVDNVSEGDFSNSNVIAGIAIKPEKGLKIMPNIRYNKPNEGDASTTCNLNFEFNIK
ncbi:MAG: hypothetical protein GWP19_02255 [Planctomycetia bacterium]|nr:hypothetical protein [Planctomycetia bacterium]